MSDPGEKLESQPPYGRILKVCAVVAIVVAAIYALQFASSGISDSPEQWGQFGDYVGGLLNPAFSLVVIVLLIHSLHQNREALRFSRNELELTRKEFAVLQVLLEAEGAVVSAEELLDRAWDEHTDPFTNVVRVTIMKLRKSLGALQPIETVRGVGYRIP